MESVYRSILLPLPGKDTEDLNLLSRKMFFIRVAACGRAEEPLSQYLDLSMLG